ncbi:natriuretic peptide A-like [Festucalex cinctus]
MKFTASLCCFHLLFALDYVGGKTVTDFQTLKPILEDMDDLPRGHEETWKQRVPRGHAWDPNEEVKADVVALLFKDLLRTSKRNWARYRKGGMRSCFGVRLDRIGSFGGLGC